MKKDNRYYWCIVMILPDGTNYYCGVSKIKAGNQWAVGTEWSLDRNDAVKFISKDTAETELKNKVLPDNEMAFVTHFENKNYITPKNQNNGNSTKQQTDTETSSSDNS